MTLLHLQDIQKALDKSPTYDKVIPIKVPTPDGKKFHCQVKPFNDGKDFCLYREVTNKDIMHKFHAYSFHPDVLAKFLEATYLILYNKDTQCMYQISMHDAMEHGFIKEYHSGGSTYYIPIKHFSVHLKK